MTRGRRIQLTLEELKYKVDNYFKECDEKQEPYTIEFLALSLGTTRSTLNRWENEEIQFIGMSDEEITEFCDTIKMAKARCEAYASRALFTAKNSVGIIFNLKNNYGWIDKQEVNTTNTNMDISALKGFTKEELLRLAYKNNDNLGNTQKEE